MRTGYVHWYHAVACFIYRTSRSYRSWRGRAGCFPVDRSSFVAIMLTGRYSIGFWAASAVIIVGCLLQAAGILLLTNVTPATSHRVPMMIFALMLAAVCASSTRRSGGAFLGLAARRDMPDASALWNLNRQISFSWRDAAGRCCCIAPSALCRLSCLSLDLYCRRRYHPVAPLFTLSSSKQ